MWYWGGWGGTSRQAPPFCPHTEPACLLPGHPHPSPSACPAELFFDSHGQPLLSTCWVLRHCAEQLLDLSESKPPGQCS